MRRNWRARLTPFQQRIYDRSTTTTAIELDPTPQLYAAVKTLPVALAAAQQSRVATLSQTIVNHICWRLGVRTVQVRVHGIRPSNRRGELHGLYTQYSGGSKNDSIQVWMRTAKRQQTVAFRTFLRTLLHEVCHHSGLCLFPFSRILSYRRLLPARIEPVQNIAGSPGTVVNNLRPNRSPLWSTKSSPHRQCITKTNRTGARR